MHRRRAWLRRRARRVSRYRRRTWILTRCRSRCRVNAVRVDDGAVVADAGSLARTVGLGDSRAVVAKILLVCLSERSTHTGREHVIACRVTVQRGTGKCRAVRLRRITS